MSNRRFGRGGRDHDPTILRAALLVAAAGCQTTQLVGPSYVHEIYVDNQGRVVGVQRCNLVSTSEPVGDSLGETAVVGLAGGHCRVTQPALATPSANSQPSDGSRVVTHGERRSPPADNPHREVWSN